MQEIAAAAFANLQDLVDDDGILLPINRWPRAAAAAVSSTKVMKHNLVAGNGVQEHVQEVRLCDKLAALQLAMKHLGLLKEGMTLELGDSFIAAINAARRRFQDAKQLRGGEE